MYRLYHFADILKIIGVAIIYALLAKLVLDCFSTHGNITLVWFPGGVGLGALLVGGIKYWPGVFIGAFIAGIEVGDTLIVSVTTAIGNTLESWIAYRLLMRHKLSSDLLKPNDFLKLIIVAAAASCISAAIGPTSLLMQGNISLDLLQNGILHWWMADVFGIVLVTPLILIWRKFPQELFDVSRLAETTAFFTLSFLLGQMVFLGWFHSVSTSSALGYWPFLFVVWAAVRLGRHVVITLIIMTAVQALSGLRIHQGLFATDNLTSGLLSIWFYILILVAIGVSLALMLFDRDRSTQAMLRSKNLLNFALDSIHTGAWDLDLTDFSARRTQTHAHIFGYETLDREWSFQKFLGHVTPKDREYVKTLLQKAIAEKTPLDFNCQIRRTDGEVRWIRVSGCHQFDSNGTSQRMAGIVQDITDTKAAAEIRQLALLVYENCSEGMMVTEADGSIVSVNPAFSKITGYEAEEVVGKNPRILSSGRHNKAFFKAMWQDINTSGQWRGEIWNRRKDGELYIVEKRINTVFDQNGVPIRHIGLFSDITERKFNEELLYRQANFDVLTGATNRHRFYQHLEESINKTQENQQMLALLMLDLDHFRTVNAKLGYKKADQLLQEVTQRILSCVGESDIVARIGGDEFAIILSYLNKVDIAQTIAQAISTKITEPFLIDNKWLQITCSIGITMFPNDGDSGEALQHAAEKALEASKKLGDGHLCVYSQIDHS